MNDETWFRESRPVWYTPSGNPASRKMSSNSSVHPAQIAAGLTITVLPSIRFGAVARMAW